MEETKTKKKRILPIMAILFALALIAFGIYNIMWFSYLRIFDELLDNEKLHEIRWRPNTTPEFLVRDGREIPYSYNYYNYNEWNGWKTHSFYDREYNTHGYIYIIFIPPYLKRGYLQIHYQTDEFGISLFFRPHDSLCALMLEDRTTGNDVYVRFAEVDKNGQPVGMAPDDSEENYGAWLVLYEQYNEHIMEMVGTLHEMYGHLIP